MYIYIVHEVITYGKFFYIKEWCYMEIQVYWVDCDDISDEEYSGINNIAGSGRHFQKGMRWNNFLEFYDANLHKSLEAIRSSIINSQEKRDWDWHSSSMNGIPRLNNGYFFGASSDRWGDLLAAVWSEHDNKDYSYTSFFTDKLLYLQLNRDMCGYLSGDILDVADSIFWHSRLKDSKIDNCVRQTTLEEVNKLLLSEHTTIQIKHRYKNSVILFECELPLHTEWIDPEYNECVDKSNPRSGRYITKTNPRVNIGLAAKMAVENNIDIEFASFANAIFKNVDFTGKNLKYASFAFTTISHTRFVNADIEFANFNQADICDWSVDFTDAITAFDMVFPGL